MKRRKYAGAPFPKRAFAEMSGDGTDIDPFYPSFEVADIRDLLHVDSGGRWLATYKLVSVRHLRRVSRVVER